VRHCSILSELDFRDVSGFLKITKRVIDGGKTNRRQKPLRFVENLVRRQMMFGAADNLQNDFALFRQTQTVDFCVRVFHTSN
jgi:hypothetical protein